MKYSMRISPVDDCVWINGEATLMIDGDTAEEAMVAAMILDSHSQLTEENAKLRELVEFAFNEGAEEGSRGGGYFSISKSRELLNKLNEQQNEQAKKQQEC